MTISVFLADDHAIVRDGLRALLNGQPEIEVVGEAIDGHDAVESAKELEPDVVIMDVAMPTLNGIEATRQIIQALPDVKVIILSMHATSEHIYLALQAGAAGYLLKESAGAEVIEAVHATVAGSRYLSQKISDTVVDDYLRRREEGGSHTHLDRLTKRERKVMQLVVEGKSSLEIAEILFLSPKTVDTYRSRMMRKLGIDNIPDLVKFAIKHGLTKLD